MSRATSRKFSTNSGFVIAGIASSGIEALTVAGETRPDLALVDIKIAGPMDGVEVALLLRSRFGVRSIFLSAWPIPR